MSQTQATVYEFSLVLLHSFTEVGWKLEGYNERVRAAYLDMTIYVGFYFGDGSSPTLLDHGQREATNLHCRKSKSVYKRLCEYIQRSSFKKCFAQNKMLVFYNHLYNL